MMKFYGTGGGRRFIDGTIPELVLQVKRVAIALERIAALLEARGGDGGHVVITVRDPGRCAQEPQASSAAKNVADFTQER